MQENINYEIIDLTQKERWNKIIQMFLDNDVFYLPEYVESFKYVNTEVPKLFYYDDGKTKAINVFNKRDISDFQEFKDKLQPNKYYDISSPYGYGGFLIDGENFKDVNKQFINYCKQNNIVSEFVRFSLFNKYIDNYYGEVEKVKPNIIRKINKKPEEMLMEFEHKVRKNLKRANANNLKIMIDSNGKTLGDFLNIYYDTMKRNDAKEEYYFPKEFFKNLISLNNNSIIFNVVYEEIIIATELVLYSKANCYSFLGGTLSEYFNLRPNDFLKYEIIKWAYEKNIKNFVLGGGYTNSLDDGIFRYKKSFAPKDEIADFYIGKMIFNKEVYENLVNLRKEKINNNYFPLYRSN